MDIYELIETKHAGQYRNKAENGAIPYTDHLYGVAAVISSVLNLSNEILDEGFRMDVINAALGHDLIEDTDASEDEIISATNEKTLEMIRELSNPVDDSHTEKYMLQLSTASEEARIVKYADLVENTLSVVFSLRLLGKDWLVNFYEPILAKTSDVLQKTDFEKYPITAKLLRELLYTSRNLLDAKKQTSF